MFLCLKEEVWIIILPTLHTFFPFFLSFLLQHVWATHLSILCQSRQTPSTHRFYLILWTSQLLRVLNDYVNPLSLETVQQVSSSGMLGNQTEDSLRRNKDWAWTHVSLDFCWSSLSDPATWQTFAVQREHEGEPRQFGLRCQNVIGAVGANCFHMKYKIQSMNMEFPLNVRALCTLDPACLPSCLFPF